jgi:hypothetical protein
MKNLFYLLAFLSVLAVGTFTFGTRQADAFANDVVIQAATISGFYGAELPPRVTTDGAGQTLRVSATSGNATLVCQTTNCLQSAWVNIGGFIIALDGVNYTVKQVPNRNTVVLTVPYGGTTGLKSVVWHPWIQLRIYALSSFVPNGETAPQQAGAVGSEYWARRYACSVISDGAGSYVQIPQVMLPATTNALTGASKARYYAGFYSFRNDPIADYLGLTNFCVPPSPNPTTWYALQTAPCTVIPPSPTPTPTPTPVPTPTPLAFWSKEQYDALPTRIVPFRNITELNDGLQAADDPLEQATRLKTEGVPTGKRNVVTDFGGNSNVNTVTGTIASGSYSLIVNQLLSFKPGNYIAIPGLGVAGATFYARITAIDRATKTFTLDAAPAGNGTGVTVHPDNFIPIQNALNELSGSVYFPAGFYRVFNDGTRVLRIRPLGEGNPTILEGDGQGAAWLRAMGNNDLFRATGRQELTNLQVKNMSFDTHSSVRNTTRGWAFNLGEASVVNFAKWENVQITGFRGSIFCNNCQGGGITDSVLRGNKAGAIFVTDQSTWLAGNENNVLSFRDVQHDFQPDPNNDNDRAVAGLSMVYEADNAVTDASYTVTAATPQFLADDLGRVLEIPGEGTDNGNLVGVILEVISNTQIRYSTRGVRTAPTAFSGAAGTIWRIPTSSLYLYRANWATLENNIFQGNFGSSTAAVNSVVVRNSGSVNFINHYSEQGGGSNGAHVRLINSTGVRFEGFKTNSQGACTGSSHCWEIWATDTPGIRVYNAGGSLSIQHNRLDGTSTIFTESQYGAPDLSNETGPQKEVYGDYHRNFQWGNVQIGTNTMYDGTFGDNLFADGRLAEGIASWSTVVPGSVTWNADGQDRYKYYLRVNTTGLATAAVTELITKRVNIPDGVMPQNFTFSFDYRPVTYPVGSDDTYSIDFYAKPSAGGVGYNWPTTFNWNIPGSNAAGLTPGHWYRLQVNLVVPSGTGRFFDIAIRGRRGALTPIVDFSNFQVMQGRHGAFSNKTPVNDVDGGKVYGDLYFPLFAGGGIRGIGVDNDGKVVIGGGGGGGGGGVSSVGLSLPSTFSVTGSPVTSTGTLTAAWANQTSNKVLASPDGSTGTPSFRALVAADLPATAARTNVANTWTVAQSYPGLAVTGSTILTSGTPGVSGLTFTGINNATAFSTGSAPIAVTAGGVVVVAEPMVKQNDLGTSLSLSGSVVDVNQAWAPTWTAAHVWNPGTVPNKSVHLSIAPRTTDGTRNSSWLQITGYARSSGVDTSADWRIQTDVTDASGGSGLNITSGINNTSFASRLRVLDVGGIRLPSVTHSSPAANDIWVDNATGLALHRDASGLNRAIGGHVKPTTTVIAGASQNNLSVGNFEVVRLSNTAGSTISITGILAGIANEQRTLWNVSTNTIQLPHESVSSTAANRFITPGGATYALAAGERVDIFYDAADSRWRVGEPAAGAGGGLSSLGGQTGATQTFSTVNDTNVTAVVNSSANNHAITMGWTGTLAAGRLNSNVVQSVVNDANITGSISAQALTLGFTGTLAKGRQNAATVYTDQANTYGAFVQTFRAGGNFLLADSTDTTKRAQFDVSNVATATTRTVNIPNANSTTVQADTGAANQFLTAISAQGVISKAQPSFSNLSGAATAGQLPATAVNAVTPDTNITGSISAQTLTLGFTGTLAKSRQNAATVYNDGSNTYSSGDQDFGLADSVTLPKFSTYNPTTNARIGYDNTDNVYRGAQGASTRTFVTTTNSLGQILNANVATGAAITYSKLQNVSATSRVLGRIGAGAGVIEELTGANLATIIGSNLPSSVAGTANQVLVNGTSGSAQTGALTLTLPQSIATTSTVQLFALNLNTTSIASRFSSVDVSTITTGINDAHYFYSLANPATASSAAYRGMNVAFFTGGSANFSGLLHGYISQAIHNTASTISGKLYGAQYFTANSSTGTLNDGVGVNATVVRYDGTYSVGTAFESAVQGSIGTGYGFRLLANEATTKYGIVIESGTGNSGFGIAAPLASVHAVAATTTAPAIINQCAPGAASTQAALSIRDGAASDVGGFNCAGRMTASAVATGSVGTTAGVPQLVISSNVLEQRNSTNAQSFRLFNSYTSGSNYERLNISGSSNSYLIQPEALGTGTVRELVVGATGSPTRITTNLATPSNLALRDGDWWVDCLGTSPSRVCAIKVRDGGATRTIASMTY